MSLGFASKVRAAAVSAGLLCALAPTAGAQGLPDVKPVLTVTAVPQTITLGDPPPTPEQLTATITGLLPGDLLEQVASGAPLCGLANGMPAHAGTYEGGIVCVAGSLSSALYDFAFVPGTLTVLPRSQSIAFPLPSLTYGDAAKALGATATSGLPVTYVSATPATCSVAADKVHAVAAGECSISATRPADADHLAAPPVTRTFTIAKAPLTLTANPITIRKGAAAPVPSGTVSGFVNGENAQTANLTGAPACAVRQPAPTAVGVHSGAITCAAGTLAAPNYVVGQTQPATFTIQESSATSASGGGGDTGAAKATVQLLTKRLKGSPVIRLQATAKVKGLRVKLRRGTKTIGTGKLGTLLRARTVKLAPKRRLKAGVYVLEVTWKDGSGRAGKRVFKLRAR